MGVQTEAQLRSSDLGKTSKYELWRKLTYKNQADIVISHFLQVCPNY